MTRDERARFIRHMRGPALSFAVLLICLGGMVTLGGAREFHNAYVVEAMLLLVMVLTILLVSMEILQEPPITRVFAALGFMWMLILFGMTLTDYLGR